MDGKCCKINRIAHLAACAILMSEFCDMMRLTVDRARSRASSQKSASRLRGRRAPIHHFTSESDDRLIAAEAAGAAVRRPQRQAKGDECARPSSTSPARPASRPPRSTASSTTAPACAAARARSSSRPRSGSATSPTGQLRSQAATARDDPARFRAAGGHQHLHQDAAPAAAAAGRGPARSRRRCPLDRRLQPRHAGPHAAGSARPDRRASASSRSTIRRCARRSARCRRAASKVVTLATDILHVPRVAYVGIDNRAGRPAGRLSCSAASSARPSRRRSRCSPARSPIAAMRSARWGSATSWRRNSRTCTIVELREMLDDREKAYAEAAACSIATPTSPASTISAPATRASRGRCSERGARTLGRLHRPRG